MSESENRTLCMLYKHIRTQECFSSMPKGSADYEMELSCLGADIQSNSSVYYYEEEEKGVLTCYRWISQSFSDTKLILPVIVFAALCLLLAIMVYKSVKERAFIRQQYLAHYKELKTDKDDKQGASTRIPHQEFKVGGLTMTFQVASNLQNKPPAQAEEAGGAAIC